jgi:hypothetical protein
VDGIGTAELDVAAEPEVEVAVWDELVSDNEVVLWDEVESCEEEVELIPA